MFFKFFFENKKIKSELDYKSIARMLFSLYESSGLPIEYSLDVLKETPKEVWNKIHFREFSDYVDNNKYIFIPFINKLKV